MSDSRAQWCPCCKGPLKTMVRTVHHVLGAHRYARNGRRSVNCIMRCRVCPTCKVVVRVMRWSDEMREPQVEKIVVEKLT